MTARRPWKSGQSGEAGFSLVEVVLAIGLLAGVLLSICSMFILGGKQLKTGKTLTEATALAHAIMETFDNMSYTSLYTSFGAADTDTSKTATSNSGTNPLNQFQAEIDRKLAAGSATIVLTQIGGTNFGDARGIKVVTTLNWSELGRAQSVTIGTVRF